VRYQVKAGDTLETLAQRYDLSVGSIARINNFSPQRTLVEGSAIILYVPSKDAPKPDPRQAARD
jgi:LysM repeat protein